jgi:hypothetical protein
MPSQGKHRLFRRNIEIGGQLMTPGDNFERMDEQEFSKYMIERYNYYKSRLKEMTEEIAVLQKRIRDLEAGLEPFEKEKQAYEAFLTIKGILKEDGTLSEPPALSWEPPLAKPAPPPSAEPDTHAAEPETARASSARTEELFEEKAVEPPPEKTAEEEIELVFTEADTDFDFETGLEFSEDEAGLAAAGPDEELESLLEPEPEERPGEAAADEESAGEKQTSTPARNPFGIKLPLSFNSDESASGETGGGSGGGPKEGEQEKKPARNPFGLRLPLTFD